MPLSRKPNPVERSVRMADTAYHSCCQRCLAHARSQSMTRHSQQTGGSGSMLVVIWGSSSPMSRGPGVAEFVRTVCQGD